MLQENIRGLFPGSQDDRGRFPFLMPQDDRVVDSKDSQKGYLTLM